MPFTNDGLAALANKILGTGANFNYGHWGTSTTAFANADTGLIAPASEARVAATSSTRVTGPAPSVLNDTAQQVIRLINSNAIGGATKAITEFGLFNDPTAGLCIVRDVFAAYNVGPQEGIEFTVQIQAKRG